MDARLDTRRESKAAERSVTLVWIDAREALILRWVDDSAQLERIESEVPSHRKSSGHVRHDPSIRPGGGGGTAATSGEPHRIEHLARFLDQVAGRLPEGDLDLLGPGMVHEKLAGLLRERDHRGTRRIEAVVSGPRTERQLVARLRHLVGHEPRRRTGLDDRSAGPTARGRRALAGRAG